MRDFFFQAEDGIRDGRVTGVQTCALPICPTKLATARNRNIANVMRKVVSTVRIAEASMAAKASSARKMKSRIVREERSEERRVGKECRSGWCANHGKRSIGVVRRPITTSC